MTKRLQGRAREQLLHTVAARYAAGETIRQVAEAVGYSYTATRSMLLAAGVVLRDGRFGGDFQPRHPGPSEPSGVVRR